MTPERRLQIAREAEAELTGLSYEPAAVLFRKQDELVEEQRIRLQSMRRVVEGLRASASWEERERVRRADLAYVAPPAKIIKVVKEKRAREDAFDLSSLPEA